MKSYDISFLFPDKNTCSVIVSHENLTEIYRVNLSHEKLAVILPATCRKFTVILLNKKLAVILPMVILFTVQYLIWNKAVWNIRHMEWDIPFPNLGGGDIPWIRTLEYGI
ncbi:hypothetical protein BT96DRAFT_944166 [Gymnopus androsaceus JB14]|uniref:Uncharacterized protein n=1 Tax=Gymnopus androsaceus JB14 TaxID=1447944 RepID=A0A6A4H7B0_9AGAR|nr:hypothetical protein BT96DRAFT_944166 [Gymnopus androsaceus JB14]